MILSAQTLRKIKPVSPFVEKTVFNGKSYGCSVAGYDVRINLNNMSGQQWIMEPQDFRLFSCIEYFDTPKNVVGRVCDKSSWLRNGLRIGNTVIEPGWKGYLTIELYNCGQQTLTLIDGDPIAQILYEFTDQETEGYTGKYQNQKAAPQEAIYEV